MSRKLKEKGAALFNRRLKMFEQIILRKLRSRSRYKTMCPSEVLPVAQKQNKLFMEQVRTAASTLVAKGQIVITQKGKVVDALSVRGPIRLRLVGPRHRTRNVRAHPEDYRVARGEQGVLTVEPYKSELLPHWKFKTPDEARRSAQTLFAMFKAYQKAQDFIGMDMARKFIQMGGTRSRRYANHAAGRKYASNGEILPLSHDAQKAESADIFFFYLAEIENSQPYADLKQFWRCRYG